MSSSSLKSLRSSYLAVHALLMLADWLQGTNMYTLYQSYGVNVGALFLTGFCTSAICGTFVGTLVDYIGRRNGCILYCVLEILIQLLEHVNDFRVLLAGRVIGGLTTSLLFSAFESWLVATHRSKDLDKSSLSEIFSVASVITGLTAVLAGLIARVTFLYLGDIGPFQVAAALTFIALCLIFALWEDDKGSSHSKKHGGNRASGIGDIVCLAWKDATASPTTIALGLSTALFEGAMYTFVFLWVPVLQRVTAESYERAPTELVFSCMMVCIAIGGIAYKRRPLGVYSSRSTGLAISAAAAASMASCAIALSLLRPAESQIYILVNFFAFEATVGAFNPWAASARSEHFPSRVVTTVMNMYRVPLNGIVVMGVYLADALEARDVFWVCFALHALAFSINYFMFEEKALKQD